MRALLLLALCVSFAQAADPLPDANGVEIQLDRPEWKLWLPGKYTPPADGKVDLLIHFHGHPPVVRNNVAHAELNAAVVTVNYNGLSSVYRIPFSDEALFQTLLDVTREALSEHFDASKLVEIDHLALSSFSAGYGAVRQILKSPDYREQIDAILAADSLYASTAEDGTPEDEQMADYKQWAEMATRGEKRFVFTHTRVETPTYESTAETGDELLEHLDLPPESVDEEGLGPLKFHRKARRGDFVLWGSPGKTGEDHMDHLRFMAEWLGELGFGLTPLKGDANGDGEVNAADYSILRDGLGTEYTQQDLDDWRENFGAKR